MKQEIWKDIPGYEGLYMVSNMGSVKSSYTGEYKILKGNKTTYGYYSVVLYKSKIRKEFFIHRLVGITFIPNPDNKPQINHINGVRIDNRVENLEWCTAKENVIHSYKILGRVGKSNMKGKLGKLNHNSKKVNQYDLDGNFIKTWDSLADAQRITKINRNCIGKCCRGEGKLAGGFIWKYFNN